MDLPKFGLGRTTLTITDNTGTPAASGTYEPLKSGVISVTMIHAGEATNVIPDDAVLRGTLRSFKPEVQELVERSIERICAGDVVMLATGEKHWHGATASSSMTHVALSEGTGVEWLKHVTDAEYANGPADP